MMFDSVEVMEIVVDGDRMEIHPNVNTGDYAIENGWKFIVTDESRHCDCGKGMYCPYVIQEKV